MADQTLQDILGVPEDSEPAEVRQHARENIDEYKDRIGNADDKEAAQNRIILAFEVLTDPEERYLYELLGHDRYVSERLDKDEIDHVDSGSQGLTAVFDDEASSTDTQIFDPSAGSDDTEVFNPDNMTAEVAGAQTTIGGSAETEPDLGDEDDAITGPQEPDIDQKDDAVTEEETPDETEKKDGEEEAAEEDQSTATEAETVVKERTEEAEEQSTSIEDISQSSSIVERLSTFPLSKSPLSSLPLMGSDDTRVYAGVGYGAVTLGVVALIGTFLPFGSVTFGGIVALSVLYGFAVTYVAGSLKFERNLTLRMGVGALACLPLLYLGTVVVATTPGIVMIFGFFLAGLTGASASNTYIEATRKHLREERKGKQERGGQNYTKTDPTVGDTDDSTDGEAKIETFLEEHSGRTGSAAQDLDDEADIHSLRNIVPERHIGRELFVKDTRSQKEVPISQFESVENSLRTDVAMRDNHHPDAFENETYEYLVPQSVEDKVCPSCTGNGRLICSTCDGNRNTPCSGCGGGGRTRCGRCSGSGVTGSGDNRRTCSGCSGTGQTSCGRCNGSGTTTCSTCSGSGQVVCDRCDGDTQIVQFTKLTREYEPEETTEYVTESIPRHFLVNRDGNRVKKERNMNTAPDADDGAVFMKEHEVHEIPTDIVTYEYAGNLWELYDLDGHIDAPKYPRELGTRTRVLAASTGVLFSGVIYVGALGPAGIPV